MTVAEIALAIMLVAGAGWLVRGFANLRNTDAGFVTGPARDLRRLVSGSEVPRSRMPCGGADLTSCGGKARPRASSRVGPSPRIRCAARSRVRSSCSSTARRWIATNPRGHTTALCDARDSSPRWARGLMQGRDFGPEDRADHRRAAIINRVFVERNTSRAGIRSACSFRPAIRHRIPRTR